MLHRILIFYGPRTMENIRTMFRLPLSMEIPRRHAMGSDPGGTIMKVAVLAIIIL